MKKLTVLALFFVVALIACTAMATPDRGGKVPTGMIPAQAAWVIHIDAERFKETEIGDLILGKRNPLGIEIRKGSEEIKNEIGFNPLKEISAVTLFGYGFDEDNSVVCIRGNFDHDHLLGLLRKADDYKKFEYGKFEIHKWESNEVGVFAAEDLVLIGKSVAAIKKTLDVIDGDRESIESSGPLRKLLRAPQNAFLIAAADNLGEITGEDGPHAAILQCTAMAGFLAQESDGALSLKLSLTANEEITAALIGQTVRGILAFLQLQKENIPELARMANKIKVSSDEDTVSVSIACPSKDLFDLLEKISDKGIDLDF